MAGIITALAPGPPAGMRLADQFDMLWGLPVHPIAVSIAVVLLPLASLLLVAIILIPRLQRRLGWFVMVLLAAAVGVAYIAQESGAALAVRLGRPQEHADLAMLVLWFTAAQFAAGLVWFLTVRIRQRRAKRGAAAAAPKSRQPSIDPYGGATGGVDPLTGRPFGAPDPDGAAAGTTAQSGTSPMGVVLGLFAVLVAALNLVLNWNVAQSGMRATWEARLAGPTPTPSPVPSEISPSPVPPSAGTPSPALPSASTPSPALPSTALPSAGTGSASPRLVTPGATAPSASMSVTVPVPTGAPTTDAVLPRSQPNEFADTPYTRGDVAAHSRVESCWVIVGSRVYDFTGWLPVHPDSAATMAELCGTDTTGVITNQTWASLISPADLARLQIGVLE